MRLSNAAIIEINAGKRMRGSLFVILMMANSVLSKCLRNEDTGNYNTYDKSKTEIRFNVFHSSISESMKSPQVLSKFPY